MLTLGASDSLAAGTTTATTVTCTVAGCLTDTSVPPVPQRFDVLYQGQLANSLTQLFANTASQNVVIASIHLFNTAATVQTVTLAVNGTANANKIATIVLPASGWAVFGDDGWVIYSASGLVVNATPLTVGGVVSPAAATTALTASTEVVQGGTLFQLPTGALVVGQRFRWYINLQKTAAGAATWAVKVKWGTNGTTADAAIASWTSGTNNGTVDQATLIIEARITALGSGTSATAACTAYYVNTLTNATGLGVLNPVPTSTAGFDSTAPNPFMHVDITAGSLAVMTGVGMAAQVR